MRSTTTQPGDAPDDNAGEGPDDSFNVLAIDGGGIRGIFAAAVLAGLEEDLGVPIVDRFDLVVGTSTGGIIALGLGAGLTPREIVEFYVADKDRIFPNPLGWRALRHPFRAKYPPRPLEAALKAVFGERTLAESIVPLVVPSYNVAANDVYLFKTPHHDRLRRDGRVPMWAVAMATAAAPTYFPAFRLPGDHVRLIDGGVWANNPSMVGITEAVSMFGRDLADVRLLNVGTTTSRHARPSSLDDAGLLRWGRGPNVVEVLLRGQSTGAFTEALHLLADGHAHRLDALAPDSAALDRCNAEDLIAAAAHRSRIFSPVFHECFGPRARGATTAGAQGA